MAFEVTKVYKEHFPSLRFIGKRYSDNDTVNGSFGMQWGEWWSQDEFTKLMASASCAPFDDTPIGLMVMRGDMTEFAYWIGLFFPAGTDVSGGYASLDLPESEIGIGWICGKEDNGEIYGGPPHEAVCKRLKEEGIGDFRNDITDENTYCFFERYVCPRFTEKDANGNVTLDYGNYIK